MSTMEICDEVRSIHEVSFREPLILGVGVTFPLD